MSAVRNRKQQTISSNTSTEQVGVQQSSQRLPLLTDAVAIISSASSLEEALGLAVLRGRDITRAKQCQCWLALEDSSQTLLITSSEAEDTGDTTDVQKWTQIESGLDAPDWTREEHRPLASRIVKALPSCRGISAGWIQILEPRTKKFSEEDESTLLHLAHILSLAIDHQLLLEMANRNVEAKVEEQNRLEAQRLQTQKLEGIGRLAEEVAHDFNNLLTSINGFAELAAKKMPPESASGKYLLNVCSTAARAQVLTHQLLAFARKEPIEPQKVHPALILAEMSGTLKRLLGNKIELVVETNPELGLINIDVGQFEQIIVAMLLNSKEAMPKGGKLTLRAYNTSLSTNGQRPYSATKTPSQAYVCLSIHDTGTGMTKDVTDQLFEPYFTTKAKGHGKGLGLATCYGIISSYGGHVQVESEPGQGATFDIYLPRCYESASPLNSIEQKGNAMEHATGTETILLVEDEPLVRNFTALALRSLGYTVLEVSAGGQALLTVQEYAGDIHLLVTDVVLPHMSGPELAERLRVLRPLLRVLYASGHSSSILEQNDLSETDPSVLQKPFTINALGNKVRERLDTPS